MDRNALILPYDRAAVSEVVLAGPEATARAAAAGSNKQRVELEAAITSAVSDALHWLGAIKQVSWQHVIFPVLCMYASANPMAVSNSPVKE